MYLAKTNNVFVKKVTFILSLNMEVEKDGDRIYPSFHLSN